mmetsp:Transcript_23053/g.72563  ORF Transcript_23053/g.72563 Transcript_23053/m.72563 type:complete len:295 (-) Transcript_23053:59-943(-)
MAVPRWRRTDDVPRVCQAGAAPEAPAACRATSGITAKGVGDEVEEGLHRVVPVLVVALREARAVAAGRHSEQVRAILRRGRTRGTLRQEVGELVHQVHAPDLVQGDAGALRDAAQLLHELRELRRVVALELREGLGTLWCRHVAEEPAHVGGGEPAADALTCEPPVLQAGLMQAERSDAEERRRARRAAGWRRHRRGCCPGGCTCCHQRSLVRASSQHAGWRRAPREEAEAAGGYGEQGQCNGHVSPEVPAEALTGLGQASYRLSCRGPDSWRLQQRHVQVRSCTVRSRHAGGR